jgi:chemotaxis protein MotB
MNKNRDLLSQLDAKAKALAIEQERLSKVHNDYKIRKFDCCKATMRKLKKRYPTH